MANNLSKAKSLCTRSELALVRSSSKQEISKLSPADLKRAAARAQRLRDKWVGQSRGQHRKSKAKVAARRSEANARSAEKAELFSDVVAALKARLAILEQPPAPAKVKPAPSPAKPAAAKAASVTKKPARAKLLIPFAPTSAPGIQFNPMGQLRAQTAAKRIQFKIGHLKRTQGHRQASNKRSQARRDARGRS